MKATRFIPIIFFIALLAGYSLLESREGTSPSVSLNLDQNTARLTSDAIAGSEHFIAALVYKFEDQTILKSLEDALKRGIKVRLLADEKEASDKQSLVAKAYRAGAEVRLWNRDQGKLHAKCLIVDGQWVLSGSFNWTDSAAESNIELILSFENPETVQEFSALFERLWEKGIPLR